jgi:hypothetical protein
MGMSLCMSISCPSAFRSLRLMPGDSARLIIGPMATDEVVEPTATEIGLPSSLRQPTLWK